MEWGKKKNLGRNTSRTISFVSCGVGLDIYIYCFLISLHTQERKKKLYMHKENLANLHSQADHCKRIPNQYYVHPGVICNRCGRKIMCCDHSDRYPGLVKISQRINCHLLPGGGGCGWIHWCMCAPCAIRWLLLGLADHRWSNPEDWQSLCGCRYRYWCRCQCCKPESAAAAGSHTLTTPWKHGNFA